MMKWILAVSLALGVGYHYWKNNRPIRLEPPPVVRIAPVTENRAPVQKNLFAGPVFRMNGYTLTALAEFSVAARVIMSEHYSSDRGAELAQVDLALGWGPMIEARVLNALQFSQSGRFYFWRYKGAAPPIPRRDIELSSANMHMIPGSDALARRLRSVGPGDFVRFRGYLVRADASDGWRWISSTNREDTGSGACELVFVQELEVVK